jgi:hypothetical protein
MERILSFMRAHSAVLALLLLCSTAAYADSLDRISPQSIYAFNPEVFIQLYGTGLAGSVSTEVQYVGQVGTFTVEASNASSTLLEVWVPIGVTSNAGRYAVSVIATDDTAVRTIGPIYLDVVQQVIEGPPLLGLPEIVLAEATSSAGAVVSFDVTAQSQGTATGLSISCNHASGSTFPVGTTNVSCTATDSFGSATGGFLVVISDTGRPVLNLPTDIVSANPVVSWTATANDVIDGPLNVLCFPASGSTFATGVTTVQCQATDFSANTTFGSFTVTVTGGAPILTLPADITVEATSPTGTPVTYTVTATEGGVVSCSPASGSLFPLGTTTVNCTATNAAGSTSGSFTVTVRDTTPPDIVRLTASPSTLWPPDHKMVPVTVTAVVIDNGDANPLVHIISVSSNQPVNGTGDGDTAPDWEITGPLTVNLRAERANNEDRKYTITVEAVDASGNASHSQVEVKVTANKGRAVR